MGFGFKQPLVGEKRCVTTLIMAAKETKDSQKASIQDTSCKSHACKYMYNVFTTFLKHKLKVNKIMFLAPEIMQLYIK